MKRLVLALLLVATEARAECTEVISAANAQGLFDGLKDFRGSDGCTLEEVKTERDVVHVTWTKNGGKLAPIELRPKSCAKDAVVVGVALAMAPPQAVRDACPAAIAHMTSFLQRDNLGGLPVPQLVEPRPAEDRTSTPPRWQRISGISGAVLVAFLAVWFIARRRLG